jgi:hypothetical protein
VRLAGLQSGELQAGSPSIVDSFSGTGEEAVSSSALLIEAVRPAHDAALRSQKVKGWRCIDFTARPHSKSTEPLPWENGGGG